MAKTKGKKDLADSAHRVWLAGLGALATAGREGEKLFETLVARGREMEQDVEGPVKRAGARVRGTAKAATTRAGKSLGGIQASIDETVSSALHRLGVPTQAEIAELGKKVEKLTRAVESRGKATKKTKKTKAKRVTKKAKAKKTKAKR